MSEERIEDVIARMRKNWLPGAPEHYWADDEITAALERERAAFDADQTTTLQNAAIMRAAILKVAETIAAHGSHWRQPYQAFCYGMEAELRRIAGEEKP